MWVVVLSLLPGLQLYISLGGPEPPSWAEPPSVELSPPLMVPMKRGQIWREIQFNQDFDGTLSSYFSSSCLVLQHRGSACRSDLLRCPYCDWPHQAWSCHSVTAGTRLVHYWSVYHRARHCHCAAPSHRLRRPRVAAPTSGQTLRCVLPPHSRQWSLSATAAPCANRIRETRFHESSSEGMERRRCLTLRCSSASVTVPGRYQPALF